MKTVHERNSRKKLQLMGQNSSLWQEKFFFAKEYQFKVEKSSLCRENAVSSEGIAVNGGKKQSVVKSSSNLWRKNRFTGKNDCLRI